MIRFLLFFALILFSNFIVAQNDIIPTPCSTSFHNSNTGDIFYDDGGDGGCPCDVDCPGNYQNAGCETTITICPPEVGCGFVSIEFVEFAMFNTPSAFDWFKVYDSIDLTGALLFDNDLGGPNIPYGTCGDDPPFTVTATSATGCLTIVFYASAVVNRSGWEGLITVQGGGDQNSGTPGALDICSDDTNSYDLFDQLGGTPQTGGTWTGPSVLTNGDQGTFTPGTNIA